MKKKTQLSLLKGDKNTLYIIYLLYFATILFAPTLLVGFAMCYYFKKQLERAGFSSHLVMLQKSFFILVILYAVISFIGFISVFLWWPCFIAICGWFYFRMFNGVMYLSDNKPYPNPQTYLI